MSSPELNIVLDVSHSKDFRFSPRHSTLDSLGVYAEMEFGGMRYLLEIDISERKEKGLRQRRTAKQALLNPSQSSKEILPYHCSVTRPV